MRLLKPGLRAAPAWEQQAGVLRAATSDSSVIQGCETEWGCPRMGGMGRLCRAALQD